MHYKMEELVPIIARLAEEYTAFESTSIPYEKAEQLMEAVLYCIHESEGSGHLPVSEEKLSARQAYEAGRTCVEKKAKQALALYHEILPGFVSFGNRCLNETFTKGIPEFFRWYDIKFNPSDTILTLDYPVLKDLSGLTGIDKIYEFLKCIRLEQKFLQSFPKEYIMEILEKYIQKIHVDPDVSQDLVENICEIVLAAVLPYILLKKPLSEPCFTEAEYGKLQEIFSQEELPRIRKNLEDMVKAFLRKCDAGEVREETGNVLSEYLLLPAEGLAVRLKNAADHGTLCKMI